jgi:hypothetical protein
LDSSTSTLSPEVLAELTDLVEEQRHLYRHDPIALGDALPCLRLRSSRGGRGASVIAR